MQGSAFPPLGHLPHWQRAGQAERPGRLLAPGGSGPADGPPPPPPPLRRAGPELERSLQFLQQQHGETLRQLHQEIDRLKRRNQDLQYRLIMQPLLQQAEAEPRAGEDEAPAEGEEEAPEGSPEWARDAEDLSPEPQEEEAAAAAAPAAPARDSAICNRRTSPMPLLPPATSQTRAGDVKIPSASSNPFLVNVLPSYMRKPPSLEECEVVIRQLWNINHMQTQELMYLRSCLDDIHKTKRIPEDYMLAGQLGVLNVALKKTGCLLLKQEKADATSASHSPAELTWFDRILTPLPAAERAVLPALKQTLGNAFAERQKRAQAVQRNRLHRTAL